MIFIESVEGYGKWERDYVCRGLRKVDEGTRGFEYGAPSDLSAFDWDRVKRG